MNAHRRKKQHIGIAVVLVVFACLSLSWKVSPTFSLTQTFLFRAPSGVKPVVEIVSPFDGSRRRKEWAKARLPPFFKPEPAKLARTDFGRILDEFGLKVGAEIGVAKGNYAEALLREWKSCERYYLIDIWKSQTNYRDMVNEQPQEESLEEAKRRVAPWTNKTVFMRMLSTKAATQFAPESLDFIYIDARHDYCAVREDVETWWPKLKLGGVFAGHDYVEVRTIDEDWALCEDGTRHIGGVKRAVDEFAKREKLTVHSTVGDKDGPTWIVEKLTHIV